MSYCRPAFLAATLLFAATGLFAQSTEILKESDIDVKLEFVESPKIGADNVSPIPSSGSAPKWLEVAITYTMPLITDLKTKQVRWIDDMCITGKILIPAEYQGKAVQALLTGKQIFVSVPCDGKKHRATLYVPPVILSRYVAPDFKMNKSAAKELPAVVLFQTKSQVSLGGGLQVPKNSNRGAALKALSDADGSLGVLKLDESIIPREQTPWAHLDFDAFDMPKPTLGGK